MATAVESWKQNLTTMVEELRALLLSYLTNKDDKACDEIKGRITGLKLMFPKNGTPQPLKELETALGNFHPNRQNSNYFLQVMKGYTELPSVAAFSEEEPPSFDQIFESYKSDETLNSLVDELLALLQKILTEADDVLSAHVARELKIILDQLKKRDRRSLYELQSWIDLSLRALAMVAETYTGTHGLALIYEAAKISYRIKKNLLGHYGTAQNRLIEEYNLTYVKKAIDQIPEISSEQEAEKYLKAPDGKSA